MSEYKRVEEVYLKIAITFMQEAGVKSLFVEGLENSNQILQVPKNGDELTLDNVKHNMLKILRNEFWCRFIGREAFSHFGWDLLYVYQSH